MLFDCRSRNPRTQSGVQPPVSSMAQLQLRVHTRGARVSRSQYNLYYSQLKQDKQVAAKAAQKVLITNIIAKKQVFNFVLMDLIGSFLRCMGNEGRGVKFQNLLNDRLN